MAVGIIRVGIIGCLVALAFSLPTPLVAQDEFVYISNITGTQMDSEGVPTIEAQTAAALDNLGTALREQGLDYSDVVVSNVFLKDARHFQGMNGIYRTYFQEGPPTRATIQADLMDVNALFQISVVATASPKEIISPSGLRSPELPYSWGIQVGNTLFVSGATSRNPDTYQPVVGDVATQTRRIFGNIGLVLEEAGMGYGDLVSCKVFLDDPRTFGEMNQAYMEFVTVDDPPARATVRAPLTNIAFSTEIQCVAKSSPDRQVVRPGGPPTRRAPYSPAIDTGDRVYVAGVTGRGNNAAEETTVAMESIRTTLEAASVGFDDVENVWVYLADVRDWNAVREVMVESMGEDMPEPTVIGTRLVGRGRVEIQVDVKR